MKNYLSKKVLLIAGLFVAIIIFSGCEKDEDYGNPYFNVTVDGISYSYDDPSSLSNDYLHISAGHPYINPPSFSLVLHNKSVGTFNASDYNSEFTESITFSIDGELYWDRKIKENSTFSISKYNNLKVIEGSFSGIVYNVDDDYDIKNISASFRVTDFD